MKNKDIIIIILVIVLISFYYFRQQEKFNTSNNSVGHKVMIFLSKSCPHCVTFKDNELDNLIKKIAMTPHNIDVLVSSENNRDIFNKYDIQYVPACLVLKDNKHKMVNGQITYDNIMKTINM